MENAPNCAMRVLYSALLFKQFYIQRMKGRETQRRLSAPALTLLSAGSVLEQKNFIPLWLSVGEGI